MSTRLTPIAAFELRSLEFEWVFVNVLESIDRKENKMKNELLIKSTQKSNVFNKNSRNEMKYLSILLKINFKFLVFL